MSPLIRSLGGGEARPSPVPPCSRPCIPPLVALPPERRIDIKHAATYGQGEARAQHRSRRKATSQLELWRGSQTTSTLEPANSMGTTFRDILTGTRIEQTRAEKTRRACRGGLEASQECNPVSFHPKGTGRRRDQRFSCAPPPLRLGPQVRAGRCLCDLHNHIFHLPPFTTWTTSVLPGSRSPRLTGTTRRTSAWPSSRWHSTSRRGILRPREPRRDWQWQWQSVGPCREVHTEQAGWRGNGKTRRRVLLVRVADFDRDSIFQQEDGALFTLIQYI